MHLKRFIIHWAADNLIHGKTGYYFKLKAALRPSKDQI